MEGNMQKPTTPSRFGIMNAIILTLFISLAIQANAADENQSTTAATTNDSVPQDSAKSTVASADEEQVMEEITVIGQKQIMSLRQQVYLAEDHAYDIFNTLNDDNDYDVHCKMVANTGTSIKRRTCLPNFYYLATAREAQQYLGYLGILSYAAATPSARNDFAMKFPIFKDKVKKLAKQNPDFLAALEQLFELNDELKRERTIYHGLADK